jgi:DNA-binding NtrC family response regulator
MARVLVIQPDRRISEFIAGILRDLGHQVHLSCDPAEVHRLLRRSGFDVVVGDPAGEIPSLPQALPLLAMSADKPFRLADLRDLTAGVAACEPVYALAA